MRAGPPIPCVALVLDCQYTILALVFDTKSHVTHVLDCGALPLQFDGHTMEAHIGGLPPSMSADVRLGCLELPRQGRPLLLGEGSRHAQSDVQHMQGSLACGNQSVPQILEAPWCSRHVQHFRVCKTLPDPMCWMSRWRMKTTTEGNHSGPYKCWVRYHLHVLWNNLLLHTWHRLNCVRAVAHPSNLLRPMVVVHLCSTMCMGHAHGVAATMQHTLCAGSYTDLRAENWWQS